MSAWDYVRPGQVRAHSLAARPARRGPRPAPRPGGRAALARQCLGALDALTRVRMHGLLQDLCARHRPAVLLVTHDVEEAIVLADRVLILAGGAITLDTPVGLPRPRDPGHPGFAALP